MDIEQKKEAALNGQPLFVFGDIYQ